MTIREIYDRVNNFFDTIDSYYGLNPEDYQDMDAILNALREKIEEEEG